MVTIGVQAIVLVAGGDAVRAAAPRGAASSSSVVLICLLALGISAASYAMGLILKDEDAFAPFIQGVSLPLLLLSGVLLPMSLAPAWLRHTSQVNPLTYVVDATPGAVPRRLRRQHVWIGARGHRRARRAARLVGHADVPAPERLSGPHGSTAPG